jgi:hypothetical protein
MELKDANREQSMGNKKTEKCAHLPRKCIPSDGENYCSQFCRDAGANYAEIAYATAVILRVRPRVLNLLLSPATRTSL